ncbi:pyruvate dehydrogenase E2 component (dihydrolipoamide acetyltransferase) [Kineosporia succinea]|uniref:Dihydrolipoamide acetyltransferase component of pyruvate dehydrogenase complex n=1 Tax=Kineosporia succinea TaxID=84632 RepID=A0ABT9PCH3_9ACTN|nr:dihydrolipoamide acetyltransferase family protein [Kineosporia succinea]MDP9830409.1 pyruvate dehydrogenase E2 component (dihydrolipoamide acetyltransferase) [Kineosporia succinea]
MIDILMPRLSDTMTEGTVSAWHKKPGEAVAAGDLLVEIETDKAIMEQEAYEAGTLAEILVAEGENVAIGTPIARLDNGTGDSTPAPAAEAAPAAVAEPKAATKAAVAEKPAEDGERRFATPLVRKLARENNIDLSTVTGTGPGGRIVRSDLDHASKAGTAPQAAGAPAATPASTISAAQPVAPTSDNRESTPVAFDAVRQAIATRLTESATTIPTFTVTTGAQADALLALRAQLNKALDGTGSKISVNDLIVRAVAVALREHPGINASYSPEGRGQTVLHARINVGVAVAAPAGLMVPVIHDADKSSVTAISARTKTLVGKANDRTLTTTEMADGTFTVSNLGMFGVEHFTAIINPPQGAILAVGGASSEVALVDGDVVERKKIRYTLTADHRIIDGALAAQFLATLTKLIENPFRIVA